MIANAAIILIGLWLAYGAIFLTPAGQMNNSLLAASAAIIVVCAYFARRTDAMAWQSKATVALGLVLGLLAATRAYYGESPLSAFWIILLSGIAVAIMALWSILYRPGSSTGPVRDSGARS